MFCLFSNPKEVHKLSCIMLKCTSPIILTNWGFNKVHHPSTLFPLHYTICPNSFQLYDEIICRKCSVCTWSDIVIIECDYSDSRKLRLMYIDIGWAFHTFPLQNAILMTLDFFVTTLVNYSYRQTCNCMDVQPINTHTFCAKYSS